MQWVAFKVWASLTLLATHCIYTSMNVRKIKFINIYILSAFTEKAYSKAVERYGVYVSIITLSHMTESDVKINHGPLQSDWTSATSWRQ